MLVNCVCPGPTETPFLGVFEGELGQRLLEGMRRAIPLRRFAIPEDIPGLVAYLRGRRARDVGPGSSPAAAALRRASRITGGGFRKRRANAEPELTSGLTAASAPVFR